MLRRVQAKQPVGQGYFADEVFVFVVQLAAMLLFGITFLHIQVCLLLRCVTMALGRATHANNIGGHALLQSRVEVAMSSLVLQHCQALC